MSAILTVAEPRHLNCHLLRQDPSHETAKGYALLSSDALSVRRPISQSVRLQAV